MKKYALIVLSLFPCFSFADDKFALVEDVLVYGNEENLEDSKNFAINDGKRIAIQKVVEQISGGKYFNLSTEYFDETIDSFSIKSETFVGNKYRARIDYRVNVSAVSGLLGSKNIDDLKLKPHQKNRLVTVNSRNVAREYIRIREIMKQYSFHAYPYSFSSNKIKYRYSDQLYNILKESGADVYYDTIY